MEEYAYRLSHELNKLSIHVSVVCERIVNDPFNADFPIFELGETRKKPRWWSHLQFARRVREWVADNDISNTLIHSHERIDCHNVTTIHSTLFNFPRKLTLPSLRSFMNQSIERKEILSQTVRAIVPVSEVISQQLRGKYPDCVKNLNAPICPGVSDLKINEKAFDPVEPVIGFIGKEWKRKGLLKVIEIWRLLRKEIPKIRLCLAGFPEDENLELREVEQEHVDILGYTENKESFFEQIDLLLHPAKQEAYGMVIAEALSVGIPVICSSECGASLHVPQDNCLSLPFDRPTELWAKHVIEILGTSRNNHFQRFSRPWQNVAEDYLKVYQAVSS
jgi:UDP-glucose:(heptosyl)LPS alpha-1,3-glucosyltransferase